MKRTCMSLVLAAALLATLAGCNAVTPASVGSIGGVDIPAGIYLLAQYNAYIAAAPHAELAEGQNTTDVKAVLAAQITGTIGDEEVTAVGSDYIDRLTRRNLEYYAAAETAFQEMGCTLTPESIASVDATTDSTWESNGELYAANGIGKESLRQYLLTDAKVEAVLEARFGAQGTEPVTDKEYKDFIADECAYLDLVELPLIDYSTFTFADEEMTEQIEALAADCADELNDTVDADSTPEEITAALTAAAKEYLPQVFTVLGGTFDTDQAAYYADSHLFLPASLANYTDADGHNTLTDPLDEADGGWAVANVGSSVVVARRSDPFAANTLDELLETYELLANYKGEDLQDELYAQGAALAHTLDESAIKVYKAANIKRTV